MFFWCLEVKRVLLSYILGPSSNHSSCKVLTSTGLERVDGLSLSANGKVSATPLLVPGTWQARNMMLRQRKQGKSPQKGHHPSWPWCERVDNLDDSKIITPKMNCKICHILTPQMYSHQNREKFKECFGWFQRQPRQEGSTGHRAPVAMEVYTKAQWPGSIRCYLQCNL